MGVENVFMKTKVLKTDEKGYMTYTEKQ